MTKAKIVLEKHQLNDFVRTLDELKADHIKASGCKNPDTCGTLSYLEYMKYHFQKAIDAIENAVIEVVEE